jgi:hypothetical protein
MHSGFKGENCTLWRKMMKLTSINGGKWVSTEVEEVHSNQEEADTKILLHTLDSSTHSPHDATFTVLSPYTDVFVLLLQNTPEGVFDTGIADKRRLLVVKGIFADNVEDICMALPTLHAFSECDSTSAFVCKGKVVALSLLQRNPEFMEAFVG